MKTRSLVLLVALFATLILPGCAATPATPEAAAVTAQRFLQSRADHDAGAVHGLLTERAREALTQGEVSQYLRGEEFYFGSLGAPTPAHEGWLQIPVADYRITSGGRQIRWPEVKLTLRYEGKHWRVAWIEPVAAAARNAYENNLYGEQLELARAIMEIDPYHYRGALEQHFAYRGLQRGREAEVAILRAAEQATPYQKPDVHDAFARFKLELGHPEDAVPHARAALEQAQPYVPDLYSHRWQADALVVLGRALWLQGDGAGALAVVKQAADADPANAGLAVLRREMGL
ncbi:MAG TPA: hypothetical protein VD969_11160 [Symbiobacteriaceae bacterium]|nr:hypothetical protein [Symbiobacteriaceae bacterium]